MSTSIKKETIVNWLCSKRCDLKFINKWLLVQQWYELFLNSCNSDAPILSFLSFTRHLSFIEKNYHFLNKKRNQVKKGNNKVTLYLLLPTECFKLPPTIPNEPPLIRRITRKTNSDKIFHDVISPPTTIINNQTSPLTDGTCGKSTMSLEENETLDVAFRDGQQYNHNPINITCPYPTLTQYGIPTNFGNEDSFATIQSIIRELETLCNKHKLYFSRHNNTIARPFFIPKGLSSSKAFYNWDKKGNGLKEMLEFMSNGKKHSKSTEPLAVSFALTMISHNFPNSFHEQAKNNGYIKHNRMNVIESAAVLSDMGVGDKKVLGTLQKHLRHNTHGNDIFCTVKNLNTLTARLPKMKVQTSLFGRDDREKKETIGLACINSIQAICIDMDRYLECTFETHNLCDTNANTPLFVSNNTNNESGCYALVGTDHGQGTAQFLLRLLLGSSAERRIMDRCDFKTRTINIAIIKCRKDPYDILKLTSEEINKCISKLKKSGILAVYDIHKTVRCIFVNKSDKTFTIKNNKIESSLNGEILTSYDIPNGLKGVLKYKIIVDSFEVLQIGDLLSQMTLQGREGMASCRCIKCNLTQNEWKLGYVPTLLNKSDLTKSLPNSSVGQKRQMLWDICPTNTIVPLLHCEIGTVNDQLFKKLFRQLLLIDSGSREELEQRITIMDMKEDVYHLKETLVECETDLDFFRSLTSEKRLDLIRKKTNVAARLKRAQRNNCVSVIALEASIASIRAELAIIDESLTSKTSTIESTMKEISTDEEAIRTLESKVKLLQWERRKEDVSIHTKVERILQSHGVVLQAYHGGQLTGGSILVFLKKHIEIMHEIRLLCHCRIEDAMEYNPQYDIPSKDGIDLIIDNHIDLFQAQDAVYAHLRLMDPTRQEIQETRSRITIMETLWNRMELSVTPKAHLIFVHAADDQERFGGLGDKIEDPIEKRHQEQMRLDAILKKMSCGFEQKMRTQLKYEWRNTNPLVLEQIEKVNQASKRKRKDTDVPVERTTPKMIAKMERQEQRNSRIEVIEANVLEL